MVAHEERRTRPSDDEIVAAIEDQRPMCIAALKALGRMDHCTLDELMSDVGEQLLRSLPRFEERSTVSLRAWANGVAQFAIKDFRRRNGRRRHFEQPLESVGLEAEQRYAMDAFMESDGSEEEAFFRQLLAIVRQRIVDQPGGGARWLSLERMAGQPVRGRKARQELREAMAEVSGLPVGMFGSEPVEADEHVEGAAGSGDALAEVGPFMAGGGFRVECSVCGVLEGEPASISVAVDAVRAHRDEHRRAA